MFFGHIDEACALDKIYPAPIVKALTFLKGLDRQTVQDGRYEIEGDLIYAQVFGLTTHAIEDAKPEVHRRYVDVQFLLQGEELIGYARDDGSHTLESSHPDRDLYFYESLEEESFIPLIPGNFAVFFPFDIHRPGCFIESPEPIRKVVVKVAYALFSA